MLNNIYINADDYGRSEIISQKIIECIDNGIINSVSVIMGADSSVYKQLAKRNIKTKLHVNLTDFPPHKGEGNELLMNMTFIKLLFLREKNRKLVKKEIDSQLEEYIKYFGTKSLMIDGHQHIQAIPWIYDYLTSILKNSGFSSIKIDVVETVIRTEDSPEENASLLMEIGMGFRAIKEAQPTPEMLENIEKAFIHDGSLRQQDGIISYGATIYRVTALP